MQLKIKTKTATYRFAQTGQLIEQITEPFVNLEAYTAEDVEALYDPRKEHLVKAFTYQAGEITGLAPLAVESIQDFLLTDSWCLNSKLDPSQDIADEPVEVAPIATTTIQAAPTPIVSGFQPDQAQRDVLRQIAEQTKKLNAIKPCPTDDFAAKTQKLLQTAYLCGHDDTDRAVMEVSDSLEQLLKQATSLNIPIDIIQLNQEVERAESEAEGNEFEEDEEED